MNFNSAQFALFATVVVGLYLVLANGLRSRRATNIFLLVSSYIFYAGWDYRFLFLIIFSTIVDYICGLALGWRLPTRGNCALLLLLLAIAALVLCAPISWAAIYSSLLPAGAFAGGWSEPVAFRVFAPGGKWLTCIGALSAVAALGMAVAIGRRCPGSLKRQFFLVLSIAANLGLLGFFKYCDFFLAELESAIYLLGFQPQSWRLGIVVPVGISFYTFQTMSYTIDIYRGKLRPTGSLIDFALFVAFFPQLVAGPIERAVNLLPQLQRRRPFDWRQFQTGAYLIGWGLFKKIFIADNLIRLVAMAYGPTAQPLGPQTLVATYAFAFQIFCDFSAYSDIARGGARLLGIELMVNFRVPYIACNPRDFWRRWHISLSTWLRDYLYFSLGGSLGTVSATYRNLMLTMVLGGLWHGARMNFVWWGIFQGLLLCGHRLAEPMLQNITPRGAAAKRLFGLLCWIIFFNCVCYGWLLFRAESNQQIWHLTCSLLTGWGQAAEQIGLAARLVWFCWPLWLVQYFQVRTGNLLAPLCWAWPVRAAFYFLLFYLTIVFGAFDAVEFIYFQF